MKIWAIQNEAEYDTALKDIEQYFEKEPEPGSAEADRFDALAARIGAYEQQYWPIQAPDAVNAIREVMA
jgi:HTH-type transcriptional regulator/antitoxin HigA